MVRDGGADMDFLGNLTDGPAPIAGGIAQIGAGALQVMDRKQQQDRQYGLQQAHLDLQQQDAARRQEAWDMQKAEYSQSQAANEEVGKLLATGKMGPGLSAIYKSAKSDVNNNGVPDKQEGISPEMSMAPGAVPMGGGKAAKGSTWGTMVLNGQPELFARGQSMVADGQAALKQLQDHLQGLAKTNPGLAAKMQSDPRFQDALRRANFMVSEGQSMQGQHYAAQADRAVTNGMMALAAGEFEDARGFFGSIGLNLPKIKGASLDKRTGLYRIQFASGAGVSMPMEEAQALMDPRIAPKERAEILKEVIQSNYQLAGKEVSANAGVEEAKIRAYAPTADQKNASEIERLDKQIAGLPEGDPRRKNLENKLYNMRALSGITDTEIKAGKPGKVGKTPARWSADDERQAKEYEQIIATSKDEEEKAQASAALNKLRSKIMGPQGYVRTSQVPKAPQGSNTSGIQPAPGIAALAPQRIAPTGQPTPPTRRIFIINPTTKQRLELVNGQWAPAR